MRREQLISLPHVFKGSWAEIQVRREEAPWQEGESLGSGQHAGRRGPVGGFGGLFGVGGEMAGGAWRSAALRRPQVACRWWWGQRSPGVLVGTL